MSSRILQQFLARYFCGVTVFLASMALLVVLYFPGPACAGETGGELLIGIEPEHNIFDQMLKYRQLADYISEQLGVEVRLTIMSRYGEIINRFRSMRLDGAILSSYTATLAIDKLGLMPVVNLMNLEDRSTSRGYIFVRRDSGIENTADMRGKNVVFVDPATTEGYLFALAYFRRHGIQDLDSYFNRHYFSGSHASAIFAVLDGRADIGAAKDSVYKQLTSRDRTIQQELRIIAESPPVPEITLCMKNDLPADLLEKLRTILLEMQQTVEGHKILRKLAARRFIPAGEGEFEVVVQLAEDADVPLLGAGSDR